MSDAKDRNHLGADFNHPHAPPVGVERVVCYECWDEFMSSEMIWDEESHDWRCKHWPECNGTGFGQQVVSIEDEELDEDPFADDDDYEWGKLG